QDGRIALFNLRKDRRQGFLYCRPWVRTSNDELTSFSRPVLLTPAPCYYVLNNDRVIQLGSGRLIVPVGLHRFRIQSSLTRRGEQPMAITHAYSSLVTFLFSDDGGRSWLESPTNYYECFPNGNGLQEPGVVELPDRRVLSWCRAGPVDPEATTGFQWTSTSRDGGMTWPRARPWRDFPSPCSPLSIKRIPSTGHLLAVWNDHRGRFRLPKARPSSWGRTPLVTAISRSEGRTWRHHRLLEKEAGQGYCYIAIHFTADDHVLLAYCCGGRGRSVPRSKMVLDTLRLRRIPVRKLYRE
ncbi:exo-alpha-sialidase, partial [bacterium]|nr:exo-alpha-sialidase [bacterium]